MCLTWLLKLKNYFVSVLGGFFVRVSAKDKYVFSWTDQAVLTLINKKDGATLNLNIYNSNCVKLILDV